MASPEKFDFTKKEDKDRFNTLDEKSRGEVIDKSQEEGVRINENLERFNEAADTFGLSPEEAGIVRQRMIEGARVEHAVRDARIYSQVNNIRTAFENKSAADITKEDLDSLQKSMEELSKTFPDTYVPDDYGGYGSTRDDAFFYGVRGHIQQWADSFKDREAARPVAAAFAESVVDRAREHTMVVGGMWGHPLQRVPDRGHVVFKQGDVGNFLGELGFFREGQTHIENALKSRVHENYTEHAREDARTFYKRYRSSGEKDAKIDKAIKVETDNIVSRARYGVQERVQRASSWQSYGFGYEKKQFTEMGYTEQEQEEFMKPAYKAAADELVVKDKKYTDKGEFPFHGGMMVVDFYRKAGEAEKADDYEYKILPSAIPGAEKSVEQYKEWGAAPFDEKKDEMSIRWKTYTNSEEKIAYYKAQEAKAQARLDEMRARLKELERKISDRK